VDIKLVDDDGRTITARDDETIGEIAVSGPNLSPATSTDPTPQPR
jgi:hypothetical protein